MAERNSKRKTGGKAVGAYLRVLRQESGLTPTEIAAELQTDAVQLWRIETWKVDPRSSLLFGFMRAVHARPDDVDTLINNSDASEQDGIELALRLLSARQ